MEAPNSESKLRMDWLSVKTEKLNLPMPEANISLSACSTAGRVVALPQKSGRKIQWAVPSHGESLSKEIMPPSSSSRNTPQVFAWLSRDRWTHSVTVCGPKSSATRLRTPVVQDQTRGRQCCGNGERISTVTSTVSPDLPMLFRGDF